MLLAEDLDAQLKDVLDDLKIQRGLLQFAKSCPELRYTMWDAKGGIIGFEQRVKRLEAKLERLQRLRNA